MISLQPPFLQTRVYDAQSPLRWGLTDQDKLRTNEYLVVAHTRVEQVAEKDEKGYVKDIFSLRTEDIRTRVMVENYNDATYRLLAEAQRIRNYAAYMTKSQHPLSFQMTAERDTVVNSFLPFIGAIFDGTTHLPWTDGGYGKTSVFITRYGPDEGLKPPYERFSSIESVKEWITDLDSRLRLAGKMLEIVPRESACDAAINCVGESFWTGEGKDRFLACWRAIDSIAKSDHPNSKTPTLKDLQNTLSKRLKARTNEETLKSLRELRHVIAHSSPSQDAYGLYHTRLPEVYRLARRLTDSLIREQTDVDQELDWQSDSWEHNAT